MAKARHSVTGRARNVSYEVCRCGTGEADVGASSPEKTVAAGAV